ncbi:MAG TPA: ABC transporter permease subunit [Caproicibacter sp.]|nr:ABC transporter permease subunit [Caproicibacter sp.]
MKAIAKKELRGYFFSPIGYVFTGVMLLLFGFFYTQVLSYQSSDYIPDVYSSIFTWIMMILLPIITMRSFSEEIRNKSDQGLLTAPVGVFSIVFGKFLASFLIFAIALTASLIPAVIITFFSSPDWPKILCTFLGSLLCGAALIAIGNFISSLTQSQIVAAIATFGITMMLLLVGQLSSSINNTTLQNLLNWVSFDSRYQSFTKGIFNVSSMVFFVSVVAVFVFLTARKLESKRWS